jgi:hypothetical protein
VSRCADCPAPEASPCVVEVTGHTPLCELKRRVPAYLALILSESARLAGGDAVAPAPAEVLPILCDYLWGHDPEATGCSCPSVSRCLAGRTNRLGGPNIERADCLGCDLRGTVLDAA